MAIRPYNGELALTGPLDGYRALEMGDGAAMLCGKLLADHGADVVKIEPPGGDDARRLGPFQCDRPDPERSLTFAYYHANKRSLTLELENADGREIFRALAARSDILVESWPPGRLDELGLGYETLREVNPRLVMASLTAFGQTGPRRRYRGPDAIPFAMGGLMYISGNPEGPPVVGPGQQGFDMAAVHAAFAILVALYHRKGSGQGQHIDVAAQEVVAHEEHTLSRYALDGHIVAREGSQHGASAPARIFPCKDGFIHIFTGERWRDILQWIGNPEALQDEVWDQAHFRRANVDVINPFVEAFMRQHTVAEVVEQAQARRIPCTPVNSVGAAIESEHLEQRHYLAEVEHPALGRYRAPGAPFRLSAAPWCGGANGLPAPLLGQHNEEICCGELGYSREDLVILRETNAI